LSRAIRAAFLPVLYTEIKPVIGWSLKVITSEAETIFPALAHLRQDAIQVLIARKFKVQLMVKEGKLLALSNLGGLAYGFGNNKVVRDLDDAGCIEIVMLTEQEDVVYEQKVGPRRHTTINFIRALCQFRKIAQADSVVHMLQPVYSWVSTTSADEDCTVWLCKNLLAVKWLMCAPIDRRTYENFTHVTSDQLKGINETWGGSNGAGSHRRRPDEYYYSLRGHRQLVLLQNAPGLGTVRWNGCSSRQQVDLRMAA
jgi:hypothetical protein